MPDFNRLVEIARALKDKKQTGRAFHVAFLLKGRKIVSIGTNHFGKTGRICSQYKKPTRPHEDGYIPNLHAEIDAVSKVKYRKPNKRMTLISLRIDNRNELAYAEPCPNCAFHLGKLGFNNIFYSTRTGDFTRVG